MMMWSSEHYWCLTDPQMQMRLTMRRIGAMKDDEEPSWDVYSWWNVYGTASAVEAGSKPEKMSRLWRAEGWRGKSAMSQCLFTRVGQIMCAVIKDKPVRNPKYSVSMKSACIPCSSWLQLYKLRGFPCWEQWAIEKANSHTLSTLLLNAGRSVWIIISTESKTTALSRFSWNFAYLLTRITLPSSCWNWVQ